MNRKIFTLLMVLALTMTGALLAQNTGTTTGSGNQQVDQSGQPEHTGRPDVDVDTGANAKGAVDVDVDAHGDADTAANENEKATTTTGTYDANAAGDSDSLPGTASKTPLLGLVGLLSLGLAFTLRAIR